MPLSSKLRADYIEMINQALDAIPMEKPADFRLAANELEKIINCPNRCWRSETMRRAADWAGIRP